MRDGYKMTKLGEIPLDWEVAKMDDVFDYIKTKSLSRAQLNYDEGKQFYIHYGDIHSTFKYSILDIEMERLPKVNSDIDLGNNIEYLKEGDLIIADASEDLEGVGACIELKSVKNKSIIGGLHTIVCRDKKNLTVNGIRPYLLKNARVLKSLKRIATGASVLGVSKGNLSKIELILPPLQEQKKIAEILSTVDEKIDLTQSKIEATQALKKGLMQQLLTKGIGHTEFNESKLGEIPRDWEVVKIGELKEQQVFSKIQDGNHGEIHPIASDFVSEGVPFIMANCITKSNQLRIDLAKRIAEEQYNSLRIGFATTNDVLLTHKGTVGLTALVKEEHGNLMLTPQVTLYRIADESILIKEYLYYYYQSEIFQKIIDKYSKQSTRAYIGIIAQQNLPIILPCSIQEQKKIAEILSKVDEKIDLLQEKKKVYQAMKKGLMQQLLTGQVRVTLA